MKLTNAQLQALRYAKRKFSDGRVPPWIFRDYRTVRNLLKAEIIEWWKGYGAEMYRLTEKGTKAIEG